MEFTYLTDEITGSRQAKELEIEYPPVKLVQSKIIFFALRVIQAGNLSVETAVRKLDLTGTNTLHKNNRCQPRCLHDFIVLLPVASEVEYCPRQKRSKFFDINSVGKLQKCWMDVPSKNCTTVQYNPINSNTPSSRDLNKNNNGIPGSKDLIYERIL